MTSLLTVLTGRGGSARSTDQTMLGLMALQSLAAAALAAVQGLEGLFAGALAAATLGSTALVHWRWSGARGTRLFVAAGLAAAALAQSWASSNALLGLLSLQLSLCLLLAYRDWKPIATLGVLGGLSLVGANSLSQLPGLNALPPPPQGLPWGLPLLFLSVQTAVLCGLAIGQQQQARAATELEFLVKAMGREGKILLNLGVIRAETPIGQRLQHVQQRMADAIRAVHQAAQRVDIAAQRVAGGSGELMARTEATASGLRDAVMSLDQINVIVQHSTEASNEAKQMSDTAAGIADRGGELVSQVVQTMKDIESSSRRINDIIAVIDGIAFQTNILALNAAVEAARAGEQGRGFAVVASEVRSLASRSAAAAKEIKSLIGSSASTVSAGTRLVSDAGKTMTDLVGSVRLVGALFEEVTADTSDHMESLNMVSKSMADLGSITQQNVALAEETDRAAADLQSLASSLAQVLSAFNLPAAAPAAEGPTPTRTPLSTSRPQPGAAASARPPDESVTSSAASSVTFF